MSRWIDAEWLKKLYKPYEDFNGKMYSVPIGAILANIDDAPSIDIVRCKECKWHHYDTDDECRWRIEEIPKDDDFCSRGERRETNTDCQWK